MRFCCACERVSSTVSSPIPTATAAANFITAREMDSAAASDATTAAPSSSVAPPRKAATSASESLCAPIRSETKFVTSYSDKASAVAEVPL